MRFTCTNIVELRGVVVLLIPLGETHAFNPTLCYDTIVIISHLIRALRMPNHAPDRPLYSRVTQSLVIMCFSMVWFPLPTPHAAKSIDGGQS